MTKLRLGLQLKEAMRGTDSANKNQYLIELTNKFDEYREDLRKLNEALKAQSLATKQITQARLRVIESFAKLATTSPISENVGNVHVGESNNVDQAMDDAEQRPSMLYIHRAANFHRTAYNETFDSFILEYAIQWEKDVVNTVTRALEQSEVLRREVDHYQAKVQGLQNERPSLFSKSKEPDPKDVERLARNKEKLTDARRLYEDHVQELCAVIEDVTDRGWKNMVPILIKLGQSDQNLALVENKLMSKMDQVVDAIKQAGQGVITDREDIVPTLDESSPIDDHDCIPPPPTQPSSAPPPVLPEQEEGDSTDVAESQVENSSDEIVQEETKSTNPESQESTSAPRSHEGDPWDFKNLEVVHDGSTKPQDEDVGTSFSPRSYMY